MTETYRPEPGSECHVLPWRPRPAVCSSAPTTVPEGAPDAANRRASVMVEPMRACHSMRRPGICDCTIARSKAIERIAILLDLRDVFGAFRAQLFDDVRRSSVQELVTAKLAINFQNQLLQLVGVFEQPVA